MWYKDIFISHFSLMGLSLI